MTLYAVLVSYTGPGWLTVRRVVLVPSTQGGLDGQPTLQEIEVQLAAEVGAVVSGVTILQAWRLA